MLADDPRCRYCGRRLGMSDATIDHVVPTSRGGANTRANMVLACFDCNQKKADADFKISDDLLPSNGN